MRGAGSQPLPLRALSKPPAGARRAARALGDGCSTSSARPIAARPRAPALLPSPCPYQRAPALPPNPPAPQSMSARHWYPHLPRPRAPAPSPYHSFLLSGRRLPRLDGVTPMAICSTVRYFWYFILSPLRSRAGPRRRRRRRRHSPSKRRIDQLWAIRRPAARPAPAPAAVRGPLAPPCVARYRRRARPLPALRRPARARHCCAPEAGAAWRRR